MDDLLERNERLRSLLLLLLLLLLVRWLVLGLWRSWLGGWLAGGRSDMLCFCHLGALGFLQVEQIFVVILLALARHSCKGNQLC